MKHEMKPVAAEMAVIATGGGICNNPEALEVLHGLGKFVFLNADEKTAANRIVWEIKYDYDGTMKNLPAYIANKNPKNVQEVRAIFHDFYEERQKIYKDLCDVEVKLEHSASKSENMKKILTALGIVGTLCDGSASKILHYELCIMNYLRFHFCQFVFQFHDS